MIDVNWIPGGQYRRDISVKFNEHNSNERSVNVLITSPNTIVSNGNATPLAIAARIDIEIRIKSIHLA